MRTDLQGRFRLSPLTARILAVNLFALMMLAGGVLYLDEFRVRLLEQRAAELTDQAEMMARALSELAVAAEDGDFVLQLPPARRLLIRLSDPQGARVRLYDETGALVLDSNFVTPERGIRAVPLREGWRRRVARFLDRTIELFGSMPKLARYVEPVERSIAAWPDAVIAASGEAASSLTRGPDGNVVINVAVPVQPVQKVLGVVMVTGNTADITKVVRAERLASFQIFLLVLALSLVISFFLARTIVRPIRRLAVAADRVRLGRAREVAVPRFNKRRDEIGQLARALSDMTQALHTRMDAIEAFAADVSHELKNPLSSLRSAVDSLKIVKAPALQEQLLGVIQDDVDRIDRLITDVSDASRLDAELSRAGFERVDIDQMVETIMGIYRERGVPRGVKLHHMPAEGRPLVVQGLQSRLGQVIMNLLDNAISFSPDGGVIAIRSERHDQTLRLYCEDEGAGIPEDNLDDIFQRFYSERPASEAFGRHSGLGLAISKQIVEAHGGTIRAENRRGPGGVAGARFLIELPMVQ